MLSSKFDWFTLSIKPEHGSPESSIDDYERCLRMLSCHLMLENFISCCKVCGRKGNYEKVLAYEGVQIKLPSPDIYYHQGICIVIPSHGIDYLEGYLHQCGCTLKDWLKEFRALSFNGYKTRITRLDYAFDDICCGDENTTLSMKRVLFSMEDGECCMKNRIWSDCGEDFDRFRRVHRRNKGQFKGLTVSLGNRESETYCRFYDKLAEQMQLNKGAELPKGCKSWVRFELELKRGNAMSLLNAYLDKSDEDFGEYVRGVALNYVRFVERTSSNVTRCVTKRWWREFLNGASKAYQLPKLKPARAAVVRWSKWFKSEVFPSLNTARRYMNDDEKFLAWLDEIELELDSNGKKTQRKELIDNFNDGRRFYEVLSAFQEWEYCTDTLADEFKHKLTRDNCDWGQLFYKYILLQERNGQYVL